MSSLVDDLRWLGFTRTEPAKPADATPMVFTEFVAELGVELTPGQRVIARVAYDGVDPCDLAEEERGLASAIFGPIERVPASARDVFVAVCGARGGKSYVLVALRMLHMALTVDLSSLAPGQVASGPIICPDRDLASEVLNYVAGAIDSHADTASLVVRRTVDAIELERPDGYGVELVVRAASARGRTGRGRSLIGAALDEAAFFLDANYQVNDEEVFRALRPRVLPGGQTLVTSTPFAQSGLLYDLFCGNHACPSVAGVSAHAANMGVALVAHAPTLALRDVPVTRSVIEAERKRDPDNARREYDAEFMSAGSSTFFDAACIDRSVDHALVIPRAPSPGDQVTAGADFGFRTNSSALAIAHRQGSTVTVGELVERKPGRGEPLRPSDVVREFATVLNAHHAHAVMSDAHYREAILEYLANPGESLRAVGLLDAPTVPSEAFVAVRAMMREGRVRLPNHERLLRQMRETVARATPGGGITVVLPRWRTGEHGDLLVAVVLALYQVAGELVAPPAPIEGTAEWSRAYDKARIERRAREVAGGKEPFWKRGVRR